MCPVTSLPFALPFIRYAMVTRPDGGVPTMPSRTRRIYDHLLIYGLSNGQRIFIEGREYPLTTDHLFLVRPRIEHYFYSSAKDTNIGIHFDWVQQHDSIHFARHMQADEVTPALDTFWREPRSIPGWNIEEMPFLDLTGRPRVRLMMEEIVELFARGDERSRLQAGALLATMILQVSYEAELLRHARGHHAVVGADAVRRVQRARELLESPRWVQKSIGDAATEVGWSSDHLRHMFRMVLEIPPHRVQNAARVRQAKEMLLMESLPIAEVALRCGFEDPCYFSRAFKKECGLSPSAFVKQNSGYRR